MLFVRRLCVQGDQHTRKLGNTCQQLRGYRGREGSCVSGGTLCCQLVTLCTHFEGHNIFHYVLSRHINHPCDNQQCCRHVAHVHGAGNAALLGLLWLQTSIKNVTPSRLNTLQTAIAEPKTLACPRGMLVQNC